MLDYFGVCADIQTFEETDITGVQTFLAFSLACKGVGKAIDTELGNLPMLRFFHERRGVPLDSPSPIGTTPCMMASRQGCDEVVKYICESKLRNFFCSDAIERWNSRK